VHGGGECILLPVFSRRPSLSLFGSADALPFCPASEAESSPQRVGSPLRVNVDSRLFFENLPDGRFCQLALGYVPANLEALFFYENCGLAECPALSGSTSRVEPPFLHTSRVCGASLLERAVF